MKIGIVCLTALAFVSTASAQSVSTSRTWTENFEVSTDEPNLVVKNIWGNVRVRPGPAGELSIVIDEKRSAPTQDLFDRSLQTLRLNIEADSNGLVVQVGEQDRWQGRDPCRNCRVDYQFEVTVPPGTALDVSTVNDGRIDVVGITGIVSASNVNGPISVSELGNCQDIDSVNGAVDVSFAAAPGSDCEIETINGDITIGLPDGSGLDVALDTFNGRMTSEFAVDSFAVPAEVERLTDNGRNQYRIQQVAGLRLEGGGPRFSISSLNGDVRFEKN